MSQSLQGNFISEWFGHRIYPVVADLPDARSDQTQERCPFLSTATATSQKCIKKGNSRGVCTINSPSNGTRQDWLACPYRALDSTLVSDSAKRLFDYEPDDEINIVAAARLANKTDAETFRAKVRSGTPSFVYFQDKLGGEINVRKTDRSPEFKFDSTMVEILSDDGETLRLGRYGVFEIQTMDFHGSYKTATRNLRENLRMYPGDFSSILKNHPNLLSEEVEGPNTSNAFKRTFYQMMFKFQIGAHGLSAGCVLAIPEAVWDGWQRHLGKPELIRRDDGTYRLDAPHKESTDLDRPPAWIYVFDVDQSEQTSPNGIKIEKIIGTDAAAFSHLALEVAPEATLEVGGSADRLLETIQLRLSTYLPEFRPPRLPRPPRRSRSRRVQPEQLDLDADQ